MKKSILFYILLLGSNFLFAQNLVLNPGFESGMSNWLPYSTNSTYGAFQIDNTIAHSGVNSLKLTLTNAPSLVYTLALQWRPLKANARYLFECYVKTNGVEGFVTPYVQLNKNGTRQFADGGLATNATTTGWKKISFRFYPPGGSDTVQVSSGLSGYNGTAWFDDLSITELKDTTYTPLSVDLNTATGKTIRTFMGTNVGPIDPSVNPAIDLTAGFQDLGIEYVRTHDFEGPCDMHVIFPDTSKNPLDSTAYNFLMTDSVIKAIIKSGAQVYFRLGESANNTTTYFNPPSNYDKWAQVALQIVKHYNYGWDKGYKLNIKYWEIYNEPDVGALWNGTTKEYIKLYRYTSKKLKQFDNTLKVGGPVVAGIFDNRFVNEFLDSVVASNLPLDFFSYHYYHSFNPYNFAAGDKLAEQMLTQHGLGNTERIVSEWNNVAFDYTNNYFIWRDDPFVNASTVASLSYYQETSVSKLLRYRADQSDLGMFYNNGLYNFAGLAYKMFSVFKYGSEQLVTSGSDSLGTSILAGRTPAGDAGAVLIANNNSGANGYKINFSGIAATDYYMYHTYRVDSTHYITAVDSGILTSTQALISKRAYPPFSDLIILNKFTTTGVPTISASAGIAAYPNPFSNSTTITWGDLKASRIEISDVTGRLVKVFASSELTSNFIEWNLQNENSPHSNGIYFVRLFSEKGIYSSKIVQAK